MAGCCHVRRAATGGIGVLWHIVKFRFSEGGTEEDRVAAEEGLRGLAGQIPGLRFVRVARSLDEPDVTGLITGLDDADALAIYRTHPAHVPVARRAAELSSEIVRLDLETPDPADSLAPN
jgi:hypothetical protein